MNVLKKYVFIENVNIGHIQNQVRNIRFTSPYHINDNRWQTTKIEALVSIVDGWTDKTNLEGTELEIPMTVKLRGDGYVDISTSNTSLSPYTIINIMLFEGDIRGS